MTPALEQARRDRIALEGPCSCGSWSGLKVVMPDPSPRWSMVRIAEEFAKAPLRYKDCRTDLEKAGSIPARLPRSGETGVGSTPRRVSGETNGTAGPVVSLGGGIHRGEGSPGTAAVTAYLSALSPNSRRGMSDALTIMARLLGQESPNAVAWHRLRYADTAALQAKLVAQGRNPDYTKKIISALRGVLKASKRLGLMTSEQFDRATELERIRGSRIRNVKNLRAGDLQALLEATRDDEKPMRSLRDRAMLALLAGGGLRRAEAASVTTAHFNRSARTLLVRGKGDKERMVPLPQWAARSLAEFVDARGFGGSLLCPVSQRDVAIDSPLAGGQAVYVVLHRLVDRAGLTQWSPPHAFRRHALTGLLRNGTDIAIVAKIAGHASIDQTARSYDTRGVDDFSRAVDSLPDPEVKA